MRYVCFHSPVRFSQPTDRYAQTLPMVAVMRLIVYMAHSLSLFDDLQERIARSIPGDQFVAIAQHCKQERPVKSSKPVTARPNATRPVPPRTVKASVCNDDTVKIDSPERATVESVEIGRALVALASVLGLDLIPPSEV
jgi:hypothetical protein